jgi:IS1 family transposase
MNKLSIGKRAAVVRCLVDGCSVRATVCVTGVAKNTIVKLLVELGAGCSEYQDRVLRDLPCRELQLDEIWSFCNAKARNVPEEHRGDPPWGDVWTWTAIDRDSRLVPAWYVGDRAAAAAIEFCDDLRGRLSARSQITTDGNGAYIEAIDGAFGGDVDYTHLVKIYGRGNSDDEKRYSPDKCLGAEVREVSGNPTATGSAPAMLSGRT